jgi:hypothetical protein
VRAVRRLVSRQSHEGAVRIWQSKTRERLEVCPGCLDKALAEGRAQGMVGHQKRAAVQVTPGVESGVRDPIR